MDRRAQRHEQIRAQILEGAWTLARERGLTGWTLRELGDSVGMRAPSLYVYFDRKHAIYDAMFAQGYEQLLAEVEGVSRSGSPSEVLGRIAHGYFDFCVTDPARFQLLFLRVIPDFTPSPASYALAQHALDLLQEVLADLGISHEGAMDLWTAINTGLASQQLSNDPHGDRWAVLIDRAVEMYIDSELEPPPA
ncbi:MAG: TetR/AcrR family transcriptional regulator [Acidimicrobiales bacterium]|nr:TetR/AcrR family transcriptional regulator [Acidimicrobiales bacterium]